MATRILVDDRWIGRHGVGRFAAEVIRRLEGAEGISSTLTSPPLHPLDPWKLAREIRRREPELFFSPGFNPPRAIPCPLVFCIYDLIHLEMPEERTAAKRAYYRFVVAPAARRAAAIITVSEFSRERIVALLGVPAGKIVVAGCGVDATFCIDGPKREAGRPYLLWAGNHKPHKNTERMMAAYARSRASLSCDLILVARATPAIRKHAATLGDPERRGVFPDRGATGLLLPSLIEGFGLPLAEAMACGTPCLVSAAASLPEFSMKGGKLL